MALLTYNELSPADAFETFDSSGSGAVTHGDLMSACTSMQLDMSEQEVDVLYSAFGVSGNDGIRIEQWTRSLSEANPKEILHSLGVGEGVEGSSDLPQAAAALFSTSISFVASHLHLISGSNSSSETFIASDVAEASARSRSVPLLLDVVRALLKFNQLGVEEGFSCFDSSGSGSVLLPALASANEQLRLEMTDAEVTVLYAALGGTADSGIRKEQWVWGLAPTEGTSAPLHLHGAVATDGVSSDGHRDADAAAAVAGVSPAGSAPPRS
jgi:Ca2+-binding EF-hand superfamily protein